MTKITVTRKERQSKHGGPGYYVTVSSLVTYKVLRWMAGPFATDTEAKAASARYDDAGRCRATG